MMESSQYPSSVFCLVAMLFCWSGSGAQTADEEELSEILIGDPQNTDDVAEEELSEILIGDPQNTDDVAEEELSEILIGDPQNTDDIAEEVFQDLIFDEEAQTYRLKENDESDPGDVGPVEPSRPIEGNKDELKRLFELYRESLTNKAYLEADTLAKRVVELSIKLNGLDSHDSAKAITNLGIAQHHNKDYESAMLNFAASVGIIERIDDRLSYALINPLQGLAATQAATGRPDLAKKTYRRAVHVSHVNEGPHNPMQVETLASMAELHISMGDLKDAIGIQENIYALQSRNIDPKSMEIIPALEIRAGWQHRLRLYTNERVTWRRIIDVIQRHHGKESLQLIPPLTSLGKSYLFVSSNQFDFRPDVSSASGETYLRRANRIAEKNPDADWMLVEDTLLSLGDYYILSGRPNRAEKIYQETWSMLSDDNDPLRLRTRREHLEQVNTLQKVFPPKYYNRKQDENGRPPPTNFEIGSMTFSYSVLPTGRISNLVTLETEPKELAEFSKVISRSLRRLIYRPRSNEGKLIGTPNVIYVHEFFYRPSDLPAKQPASTAPAAGETAELMQPAIDEE